MKNIEKVTKFFSVDGKLSQQIEGFQPRAEQLEMAKAVSHSINKQNTLVIEAGTGTGKTFAYLAPILLANKKTIISTGSKNLQDQLFKRDLPTIKQALGYSGKVALLKGRANYLCLERLDFLHSQGVLGDQSVLADFVKVQRWNLATQTGDFAECIELAEDSPVIPQLISTTDNCLGSDCPSYENCYVMNARKKALNADIVVVNHHLFFADMAVKENGFGELIPNAEVVVFDEAHQLPNIASQYFGQTLSSYQLFELCQDINVAYRTELKDMKSLGESADQFKKIIQEFRLLFGEGNSKGDWSKFLQQPIAQVACSFLLENLDLLAEMIKSVVHRSATLKNIFERLKAIKSLFNLFLKKHFTGYCYWYEAIGKHFNLHITPLSVADKFGKQIQQQNKSWIFTSATLETGGSFDYFCQRLGITYAEQKILPSPFNYAEQSLLCVPRYLPITNQKDTLAQLGKILLPVIEANQGGCFVLCTSYFMMRGLAEYFRQHSEFSILLQGETAKTRLLEQFIQQPNAVLVATSSFWEGVDVRGDALSLVIIDKLPFTTPDEPLLKARIEDCKAQGGDPFKDIQIPETVITLKQGVGRLIRDVTDRGVVIICDNRLVMRNYGETFLRSLPNSTRTRDLDKVIQFLTNK